MTSLRFDSTRFDFDGPLPASANAGNRFYGADVAAFIADGLTAQGHAAGVVEEDWGWLVSCAMAADSHLDIAIYNLNDHGEGGRPGAPAWGLWLRAHAAGKRFGFLPVNKEVATPAAWAETLTAIFATQGIVLEPWDADQDGRLP